MCYIEGELPMRRRSGDVVITNLVGGAGIWLLSPPSHCAEVGLKGQCHEIIASGFS
jgi:hypothetical protein